MSVGMYVTKRTGTGNFSARMIVPPDLRAHFGRAEIWKSLGTADKREAMKRAAPVFAAHLAGFDALRAQKAPAASDYQEAAYSAYEAQLQGDQQTRQVIPRLDTFIATCDLSELQEDLDDEPIDQATRDMLMTWQTKGFAEALAVINEQSRQKIAREAASGDLSAVLQEARQVIARKKLKIAPDTPEFFNLCNALQRGALEARKRTAERHVGEWGGSPSDPLVRPLATSQNALRAKPGESITDLFEAFYRENAGRVRDDTWTQNRMVVGLFADYLGASAHVTAITRKAVSAWKQQLLLWPVQAANTKEFAGLGFKAVIAKNAVVKKPPIADKTVNRYLSGLGRFCAWLLANSHIEADVMAGQYLGLDKTKKKVLPYSDVQLATIFASPLFTGCEADNREHIPGTHHIADWRRWIPLLAAYSGARLGELCQLMTADVRKMGGSWVMHITPEGDDAKKVKTKGSQRVVPLHPMIVASGFLDFHALATATKRERLFPEVERDTRDQFGEASRYFNSYLVRIGVKTGKSYNFHSLRHAFIDACRRNFLNYQIGPVIGHGSATMTSYYGVLPQGVLEQSILIVSSVKYNLAVRS